MPTISLDTSVFSKYFLTNLFQTRIFYKNAILDNIEGGSAQIAIHEFKFLSSILLFQVGLRILQFASPFLVSCIDLLKINMIHSP